MGYEYPVHVIVPTEVVEAGEDAAFHYADDRMLEWRSLQEHAFVMDDLRPVADLLGELEDDPEKRLRVVLIPDGRKRDGNPWSGQYGQVSDDEWWVALRWLLLQYHDDCVVTGWYRCYL